MQHYHTVIVGAGIVGSALAAFISEDQKGETLLVDRSLDQLLGSTGHAPGFVGQLNESPVLTRLAIESVTEYKKLPMAYNQVGGLELAKAPTGMTRLEGRLDLAKTYGLPAQLLSDEDMASVPSFVRKGSYKKALHFPEDGVADPRAIVKAYRETAAAHGVSFLQADITSLNRDSDKITNVTSKDGTIITASIIILATGIWTSSILLESLNHSVPIVPVGHPYIFSESREERTTPAPFVRWPETHVYARDHGHRDGFGTYAHAPQHVPSPDRTAIAPWAPEIFDTAVSDAMTQQVAGFSNVAVGAMDDPEPTEGKFNGVFALTPDNLPLVGPVPGVDNLWVAAAVWVTHAAGCARLLADMLNEKEVDAGVSRALSPERFGQEDGAGLVRKALAGYNDIYKAGR